MSVLPQQRLTEYVTPFVGVVDLNDNINKLEKKAAEYDAYEDKISELIGNIDTNIGDKKDREKYISQYRDELTKAAESGDVYTMSSAARKTARQFAEDINNINNPLGAMIYNRKKYKEYEQMKTKLGATALDFIPIEQDRFKTVDNSGKLNILNPKIQQKLNWDSQMANIWKDFKSAHTDNVSKIKQIHDNILQQTVTRSNIDQLNSYMDSALNRYLETKEGKQHLDWLMNNPNANEQLDEDDAKEHLAVLLSSHADPLRKTSITNKHFSLPKEKTYDSIGATRGSSNKGVFKQLRGGQTVSYSLWTRKSTNPTEAKNKNAEYRNNVSKTIVDAKDYYSKTLELYDNRLSPNTNIKDGNIKEDFTMDYDDNNYKFNGEKWELDDEVVDDNLAKKLNKHFDKNYKYVKDDLITISQDINGIPYVDNETTLNNIERALIQAETNNNQEDINRLTKAKQAYIDDVDNRLAYNTSIQAEYQKIENNKMFDRQALTQAGFKLDEDGEPINLDENIVKEADRAYNNYLRRITENRLQSIKRESGVSSPQLEEDMRQSILDEVKKDPNIISKAKEVRDNYIADKDKSGKYKKYLDFYESKSKEVMMDMANAYYINPNHENSKVAAQSKDMINSFKGSTLSGIFDGSIAIYDIQDVKNKVESQFDNGTEQSVNFKQLINERLGLSVDGNWLDTDKGKELSKHIKDNSKIYWRLDDKDGLVLDISLGDAGRYEVRNTSLVGLEEFLIQNNLVNQYTLSKFYQLNNGFNRTGGLQSSLNYVTPKELQGLNEDEQLELINSKKYKIERLLYQEGANPPNSLKWKAKSDYYSTMKGRKVNKGETLYTTNKLDMMIEQSDDMSSKLNVRMLDNVKISDSMTSSGNISKGSFRALQEIPSDLYVSVSSGERTQEEQQALIDAGKTNTINSYHLTGNAFDLINSRELKEWISTREGQDWLNRHDLRYIDEGVHIHFEPK